MTRAAHVNLPKRSMVLGLAAALAVAAAAALFVVATAWLMTAPMNR